MKNPMVKNGYSVGSAGCINTQSCSVKFWNVNTDAVYRECYKVSARYNILQTNLYG